MWTTDAEALTGCYWPISALCDPIADDNPFKADAEQYAIELLYAASGRQFGTCAETVRPCTNDDLRNCEGLEWNPWSTWYSGWGVYGPDSFLLLHCGGCRQSCECTSYPTIQLPRRDVRQIVSVQIDGEVLPSTAYRLSAGKLYRLDGESWPACQDWGVDDGEVGSWSVTYRHGRSPKTGGAIAAGVLASEIAKACTNSGDCMLPQRVQEITRQGITAVFSDPMEFMSDGLFGLFQVDAWVQSVNPKRLARRAGMIRADAMPDRPRFVRP